MKQTLFSLITLCLFACRSTVDPQTMDGLWKIRKVEVFKNNQLKKVIDTGQQYWHIAGKKNIEIFDTQQVHNVLRIKVDKNKIKSFNDSGQLQDDFVVERHNANSLSLSSHKKMQQDQYNIVYHLDKVPDADADDLRQTH